MTYTSFKQPSYTYFIKTTIVTIENVHPLLIHVNYQIKMQDLKIPFFTALDEAKIYKYNNLFIDLNFC